MEPIISFFYNNPVLAIILFWLLVGWLQWRSANDRFKENPEINKTWQKIGEKFGNEVEKKGVADFFKARKNSVWRLVDETWN